MKARMLAKHLRHSFKRSLPMAANRRVDPLAIKPGRGNTWRSLYIAASSKASDWPPAETRQWLCRAEWGLPARRRFATRSPVPDGRLSDSLAVRGTTGGHAGLRRGARRPDGPSPGSFVRYEFD